MKKKYLLIINTIFFLFIISQITFFKDIRFQIQVAITILIVVIFLVSDKSIKEFLTTNINKFLLILLSIFFTSFWYAEIWDLIEVIIKTSFAYWCVGYLMLKDDAFHSFIVVADITIITVLCAIYLSSLSIIPNLSFEWDSYIKQSGGFNNPNVTVLFLFSTSITYIIFNKNNRLLISFLSFYIAYYFDIYSRTFFISLGIILIAKILLTFFKKIKIFRYTYLISIYLFFLFIITVSLTFYTTILIDKTTLDWLAYSELDYLLSERLSTAINNLLIENKNSLFGVKVIIQDSVYSELFFIFGIVPIFLLIKNMHFLYKKAIFDTSFFIILLLIFSLSITGLTESFLLTISMNSILFFAIIFLSKSDISKLVAKIAK